MSDFRLPKVPGSDVLPAWRRVSAYVNLGLSDDSIALLDASEQQEREMAARLKERTAANRAMFEGANKSIEAARLEQQRTDGLSIGELREELADRIDDLNMANRAVEDAELVQERAQRRIVETAAILAKFDNVDQRAAEWQVNQLRQGSHDGMPADLVEARRAKADASEQHALAEQASAMMAGELQAARTNAEKMAQARDQAAVAVVSRHCDGLAIQVDQTLQRLHDLWGQLLSITSVWIPLAGIATSLPVSDHVRAALRRQDERPLINEEIKTQARAYFISLQSDPKATFGD